MLIEFYGKNYGCFRDEFRLSMLATDIDRDSERGIVEVEVQGDPKPLRLLRAAAIYGPNASGKSTVLRAASVLSGLLATTTRLPSDAPLEPYDPFALGPESEQPTTLGLSAVIDGIVYSYLVSWDSTAIHKERLDIRRPNGETDLLFNRELHKVDGAWTSDPQFALFGKDFRANALLLSLADSFAPSISKGIAVGLRLLLGPSSPPILSIARMHGIALRAKSQAAFNEWLLGWLQRADLGVTDIQNEKFSMLRSRLLRKHLGAMLSHAEVSTQDENDEESIYRLRLLHGNQVRSAALPFESESTGTQQLVNWSPIIYDLTHGSSNVAAFADEFDASMHPLLLRAIIEDFNCRAPSKLVRGQLIFSAHETSLVDDEARDAPLRRDQVYLTEKGLDGASRLYSVAEFKERNNLNMRRRYLQGRYGALPALGSFSE